MEGKPGTQFDALGSITRAEAAAIVYRLMNAVDLIPAEYQI
jgi:hypothetical protein